EIDRVLVGRDRINARVRELAGELSLALRRDAGIAESSQDAEVEGVVLVPILTGALVFTADLIRELPLKLSLEMMAVSSYAGRTTTSRGAELRRAISGDLRGKHVVIVDDILDSGRTLKLVREVIGEHEPASVRAVVLLEKPDVERVCEPGDVVGGSFAEHIGFAIPNEFVVGYGLDYDGHYRNLPDIATLKPEAL
ncbi:MAG: phosphoribosyltransferase family protein, partial [Planctomycetota bacterium]